MTVNLQEIHGFTSPGEYERFVQYIEGQVLTGHAEEIAVEDDYCRGEIYGGRWFRDIATGAVWRLVPPDSPFRGIWEPVAK